MKPGRELDLLVAEKVMGLDVSNHSKPHYDCRWCWKNESIDEYSTDIAAAFEIVEKMGRYMLDDAHIEGHNATFWANGPITVKGDTAPHAICLASLRARGIKVD
jgi:hypothetical protein